MASRHPAPETPPSSGAPPGGTGQPPPASRRRGKLPRALRIAAWFVGGLLTLTALALFGALYLAGHLDQPSLKSHIQSALRDEAGLAVDYDGLAFSPWSGLRARWLRVAQPPKFRAAAEDFVRIDGLDVRASVFALVAGTLSIEALHVGSVDVTLVRDESGATTLSELFPPKPASTAPPAAPSRLSQSLADLPAIAVQRLAVDAIRARAIELHAAAAPRTSSLATLAIAGTLHSAAHSLLGSDLQLRAAPTLRLEVRTGDVVQYAELGLTLRARAEAAETIALGLHAQLGPQNVLADYAHGQQLLDFDARVAFDEAAGRTSVDSAELRALDRMLSAALSVELFDGDQPRILANGKVDLEVDRLPIEVPGVALAGLKLALSAKQFAWQGDRLKGAIDWQGGVRSLGYARAEQRASLRDASWSGHGTFEGPIGNLQASVRVAALQSSASAARLANLTLELNGKTEEKTGGGQNADADLAIGLDSADLATADGTKLRLDTLKLALRATGSVAAFSAKQLPKLHARLAMTRALAATGGGQRALLEDPALELSGTDLAQEPSSESGAKGALTLNLALPSLRVFNAAARGQHKRADAALALDELRVAADVPLTLAQVESQVSLTKLRAGDNALNALQLNLDLQHPLAWSTDRAGPAQAKVIGQIASFRAADSRGAVHELRLNAERLSQDHYRLEFSSAASGLIARGHAVPGRLTAELHADAAPAAGSVKLSSVLHGASGATIDLQLETGFRGDERFHYKLACAAEKLDAFAGLIYGFAPGAASVKVAGARLRATAAGEFGGVLRRGHGAAPTLAPDPIASARGQQTLELTLTGLDYHGADRSLVIPELAFALESQHGNGGAGSAKASLNAASLRYDGAGTSLHLEELAQHVSAKFAQAPDQGVMDVESNLELGSAAQSILPGFPIGGLKFTTRVQIDRLNSIFLRELALVNEQTGTELRANGTLELRTRRDAQDEQRTLAGREALALSGSFKQPLEPLKTLGFLSLASGTLEVPFRLESGGLLGYRLIAALQAKQVSLATADHSLGIEELNGVIPLLEEFALLPGGAVLGAGPHTSPLAETRFFDVHPFLDGNDYVTARSITLSGLQPLGPLAANVRLERADFLIDQLQVGFNSGQISGQVRIAYRDGDPLVRMRLDATGIRTAQSQDVFDANAALSFVPKAMTLDGKVQLVRVSRTHLLGILDVVDPFHESASANRIRQGLSFGYPKFVRFQLHDGALDTKVELGGLVQLVRIDEIKSVPMGPILQRYVAPLLSGYLPNRPVQSEIPEESR